MALRAQAAQCAGRGAQHAHDLAAKALAAVLPVRVALDGAGGPVDGVLEQGGVAAVVLGRADDPGRVLPEDFLEADHIGGRALGFKVGVVQRDVEVRQLHQRDAGPRIARDGGSGVGQFAVKGLLAGAAREDEKLGGHASHWCTKPGQEYCKLPLSVAWGWVLVSRGTSAPGSGGHPHCGRLVPPLCPGLCTKSMQRWENRGFPLAPLPPRWLAVAQPAAVRPALVGPSQDGRRF